MTGLLRTFIFHPPPSLNVKTLGFGTLRWGGPHLQLADPCVKFPRGAKLQSTFLIRPPAFNWPKGVVIIYIYRILYNSSLGWKYVLISNS